MNDYVTDDVPTVVVLGLHGMQPHNIDVRGMKRMFRFESSDHLHQVLDSYSRGTLTVNARMFVLLYKDHIGRLRLQQRSERGQ